jgi:hypothetical protein
MLPEEDLCYVRNRSAQPHNRLARAGGGNRIGLISRFVPPMANIRWKTFISRPGERPETRYAATAGIRHSVR